MSTITQYGHPMILDDVRPSQLTTGLEPKHIFAFLISLTDVSKESLHTHEKHNELTQSRNAGIAAF